MPRHVSRRRFLQTTVAAGAAGFWNGLLIANEQKASANDKLHLGVIGIAAQGAYNWGQLEAAGGAEIIAICDVHESRKEVQRARDHFSKATFYTDFRKLIEHKGLDAVLVATPDHTHAHATLAALRNSLHVYCEKPLTHTVQEARLVADTAAKQKRVTQMGTQIHAGNNYRRVVELIQSGAIGLVQEVHTWCDRPWGGGDRPKDTPPVPDGLHWDLWLGPAADRPFHPAYVPFNWRGWWAFGGGTLADMACHHMDLPFWALKLRHPTSVAAEGPPVNEETTCPTLTVRYEYPARSNLPPVKLIWYHGGKRPPHFAEGKVPKWGDGNLFIGSTGMLLAGYNEHKLLPEDKFKNFARPKEFIPNSIGHHREWIEACKSGGTTTCNFDYAGALTEAVLLGNVSYRLGNKPLTWDAAKLQVTNEPNADRFIRKEYRKGWEL